jgi:hypothetical protein
LWGDWCLCLFTENKTPPKSFGWSFVCHTWF